MSNNEKDLKNAIMLVGPYLLIKSTESSKISRDVYTVQATINNKTENIAVAVVNKGFEGLMWYDDKMVFTVYPVSYYRKIEDGKKSFGYMWSAEVKGLELAEYLACVEKYYEDWRA